MRLKNPEVSTPEACNVEPEEGTTPTCCVTTGTRVKGDEKRRGLVMSHLGTATTDSSHARIS